MAEQLAKPEVQTEPMDVGELKSCAGCGNGVLHSGNPTFYEVEIRQCLADLPNIQRMHGLEQMMNGAVPLARIFSPNNTVAHRIGRRTRLLLCMDCAMRANPTPVAVMIEEQDDG